MAAASSLTTLSCAGSAEIVPMQRCARILFSVNYDIKQEHMSCTKEPRWLMCSSFGWLLLLTYHSDKYFICIACDIACDIACEVFVFIDDWRIYQ